MFLERSATRAAGGGTARGGGFRHGGRAAVEESVVRRAVADEGEVFPEPSLAHHRSGVATHEHGFVFDESVVIVELVGVGGVGNAAVVDGVLAVVFAQGFEDARRELEEAVGDGVKLGLSQEFGESGVSNIDLVSGQDARIGESGGLAETFEIFDVHGAAEALAE